MSQITSGLRSVLSHPLVYDLFQNLMGARKGKMEFVDIYVQPFLKATILDIGCGTARILDNLPDDINYYGFDISQKYIDIAKERYSARNAVFSCELFDQAKVDSLPCFDIVIASGLLHHLDDTQVRELASLVHQSLREGGRFVTKDPCFEAGQNPIAHYLVSHDRGENVRYGAEYAALFGNYFSQVIGEVKHRSWVPYTHYNMQCHK